MRLHTTIIGLVACALAGVTPLTADTFTIGGETDTLTVTLKPADGALTGGLGSVVGWGFIVDWQSTNNWISFTGSSLGAIGAPETNNSFLSSYTDFIGFAGGPSASFSLAPNASWSQDFSYSYDPVLMTYSGTGIGAYAITTDPALAVTYAQDTGQITLDFEVYSGDPGGTATDLGSRQYYGTTTQFSVTVTPEPGTFALFGCAFLAVGFCVRRRSQRVDSKAA